jgi:hypothetical protein
MFHRVAITKTMLQDLKMKVGSTAHSAAEVRTGISMDFH